MKNLNINKSSRAIQLALCASFIATANGVLANSEGSVETITITASRTPVSIEQSLATVQVIDRQQIERLQANSVSEILATVAGLDISSQGSRGQNASVFVRGANSNHTLVLVDGIRISSASLGSSNTQVIAPELIERIEIVKGPRAAIWGSDAIGGVIQIFTRKLDDDEYFANAQMGSDEYYKLAAGGSVQHGNGYTSISVNHEQSEGFDVLTTAEDDRDGYDTQSISLVGEQTLSSALSIDWMARADYADTEYDNAFGGNNKTRTRNHVWLARASYQQQIGGIDNTTILSVGQNRDFSENFKRNTDAAFRTEFETKRQQYSLLNHAKVSNALQINGGVDFYQESLSATTSFDQDKRNVLGVFAHALFNENNFSAEAAIRYDDVEGIDSETTYNVGTGYQVSDGTRITLNLGTGFKVPTFNDLYFPSGLYSGGNPDLISETSESLEFIVENQLNDAFNINLNAYKTDINNLIVWTPDEFFFYQPNNVEKVEILGLDVIAQYQGLGGNHQVSVSYIDAENTSTQSQLIRRAKEQLSYQFDTTVGDVNLYFEYQFKGKRLDSDFVLGSVELDAYHLINLSASYAITNSLSLNAKIGNLLDEEYQTAFNYNTQRRAVFFGINYQMN